MALLIFSKEKILKANKKGVLTFFTEKIILIYFFTGKKQMKNSACLAFQRTFKLAGQDRVRKKQKGSNCGLNLCVPYWGGNVRIPGH